MPTWNHLDSSDDIKQAAPHTPHTPHPAKLGSVWMQTQQMHQENGNPTADLVVLLGCGMPHHVPQRKQGWLALKETWPFGRWNVITADESQSIATRAKQSVWRCIDRSKMWWHHPHDAKCDGSIRLQTWIRKNLGISGPETCSACHSSCITQRESWPLSASLTLEIERRVAANAFDDETIQMSGLIRKDMTESDSGTCGWNLTESTVFGKVLWELCARIPFFCHFLCMLCGVHSLPNWDLCGCIKPGSSPPTLDPWVWKRKMKLRNHWNQSRLPSQSLFSHLVSPNMLLWLGSADCWDWQLKLLKSVRTMLSHLDSLCFCCQIPHCFLLFMFEGSPLASNHPILGLLAQTSTKFWIVFGFLLSLHAHNSFPFMFCSGTSALMDAAPWCRLGVEEFPLHWRWPHTAVWLCCSSMSAEWKSSIGACTVWTDCKGVITARHCAQWS